MMMRQCISCYEEFDQSWVKNYRGRYYKSGYCNKCWVRWGTLNYCYGVTKDKQLCKHYTPNAGCLFHRELNSINFNDYVFNVLVPLKLAKVNLMLNHWCFDCNKYFFRNDLQRIELYDKCRVDLCKDCISSDTYLRNNTCTSCGECYISCNLIELNNEHEVLKRKICKSCAKA